MTSFCDSWWHKPHLEPRVYLFRNLIIIPVHFVSPKHAKDTRVEKLCIWVRFSVRVSLRRIGARVHSCVRLWELLTGLGGLLFRNFIFFSLGATKILSH